MRWKIAGTHANPNTNLLYLNNPLVVYIVVNFFISLTTFTDFKLDYSLTWSVADHYSASQNLFSPRQRICINVYLLIQSSAYPWKTGVTVCMHVNIFKCYRVIHTSSNAAIWFRYWNNRGRIIRIIHLLQYAYLNQPLEFGFDLVFNRKWQWASIVKLRLRTFF